VFGGNGNVIEGNFIGIELDGSTVNPNNGKGVTLDKAADNFVGGDGSGARNLIAGNSGGGILIEEATATGNVIKGNFIGTDASGTLRRGNGSIGISLNNSAANNTIGTDLTGTLDLGFNGAGINIFTGKDNQIGGTGPGEANVIAFSGGDGITANNSNSRRNTIRGNSIYESDSGFGELGIDIGANNITANDVGDGDSGSNLSQNFPILSTATTDVALTTIEGDLNSTATTTFEIDFFANLVCHPSGNGEGRHYLGSTNVTTDGSGDTSFSVALPVTAQGGQITATATDPAGNTSEFSPCLAATVLIPPSNFVVINTNDNGAGSLRPTHHAMQRRGPDGAGRAIWRAHHQHQRGRGGRRSAGSRSLRQYLNGRNGDRVPGYHHHHLEQHINYQVHQYRGGRPGRLQGPSRR
jgi:hypothetical protein